MNYILKHKFAFLTAAAMFSILLLLFPHYSAFAKPHANKKIQAAAIASETDASQTRPFHSLSDSTILLPPTALAKNSSADTRDGETAQQPDNTSAAPDPAQPPHAALATDQNSKPDSVPAAATPITSIPYDGSQAQQDPPPVQVSTKPQPPAQAKAASAKSAPATQKKTAPEVAFNFTLPKIPSSADASTDPTAGLPLLSLWQPFMNTSPYSFSSLSHKTTILLNVSGLLLLLMGLALMLGKQDTPQRRTNGEQPTITRPIATTL